MKPAGMTTLSCPVTDCDGLVEVDIAVAGTGRHVHSGAIEIDVRATHYRTIGDHTHEQLEGDL